MISLTAGPYIPVPHGVSTDWTVIAVLVVVALIAEAAVFVLAYRSVKGQSSSQQEPAATIRKAA